MSTRPPGIRPGDGDLRHGSANGYKNLGCRCRACKTANAVTGRQEKAARQERGLPEGDPRHGTENGYGNWACRCKPCTSAWTAGENGRRARRAARENSRKMDLRLVEEDAL